MQFLWDEFSRHEGEQWIIVFERGGESEDSPSDDPSHPSGVGRGIAPRPQPQTGRAGFQASGFPDDSTLVVSSPF